MIAVRLCRAPVPLDVPMIDPEDADRAGPLAELDRLCTLMQDHIAPMRQWYPEVVAALLRLEGAIQWERDRLAWEVAFLTKAQAQVGSAPRRGRRRRDSGRAATEE